MPTSTRGGAAAPPVAAPPEPKPQLPLPPEPQHPALAAAGFRGGINAFNNAVASVVQAHRDAYGTDPSPGLTLDVARSDVPEHQYADLFSVPKDPLTARMQGVLAQHDAQNPTTVRPDGIVIAHTPLTARLQAATQDSFNHGDQQTPQTGAQLQKEHPWVPVEAGFLPIANFGHLVDALGRLDRQGVGVQNGEITVGGKTLSEYQQEQDLASGISVGSTPAAPPGSALAKQEAELAAGQQKTLTANVVSQDVHTVRQAQQDLVANYPAYFTGLPADGNFNQDWVRAVARFQSSAAYYRASTDRLAKDNHFDNPGEFAKAWQRKQDAIKSDPTGAQFYAHVPLAFFGNGKSVINYLDGNTHGWGFINLPTVALHSIVGVAKTGLFGAAGLVDASKANVASLSDYFHHVLPTYLGGKGEGDKEALAHSRTVLLENPSYLRIFYPDLAAHPHGTLGAIDAVSNITGDIILGNRLIVGGEAVDVGDEAALASHRYYKGATQLAFNSMKQRGIDGVGEASRLLQGGEGLNVAVAESVKSGEMTLGQYRAHVADLYHHGRTEVALPPRIETTPGTTLEPPQGGFLFHGSPEGVLKNVDPYYHTRQWREGVGFYVTENFDAAKGYALGRTARGARLNAAGEKGAVNAVTVDPAVLKSALDMDAKADPELWRSVGETMASEKITPQEFEQNVLKHSDGTNKSVRDELLHYLDHYSSEGMYELEATLDEKGIRATTHMEGVKAGTPHRVYIIRDENAVTLAPEHSRLLKDEVPPSETVHEGAAQIHAADTPNGSVLSSLRTKQLPNPSLRAQQVKAALDQVDKGLHNSGLRGTDNAANMFDSVRQLVTRAAPKNESRRIYDAKTPDDVYNWVVRNLDDRELAYKARNDFVVARATENIPKIQELNQSLVERYAAEHPNVKGKPTPLESTGPESEAEGLANFKFISGREKDATNVFDRLAQRARRINGNLLSAARFHRQVIISGAPLPGGESLFWKHAVADTGRRFVGGGGAKFGLSAEQKAAQAETSAFFKDNPAALSDFSAQRAAAEQGEVAWLTRNRPEQYVSFNTVDHLDDAKHLEGAGAYLRHMVTDDALNAYRASSATDKTALFRHVWHSKLYQNLIAKSPDFQKDAEALRASGATGDSLKALLSNLKKGYAQDWADALWSRYRSIDDAGDKAGIGNALEQAAQVAREHPGVKIDRALGQFVKDNQFAFDVREAPVKGSTFDGWMSKWTGKLLTFNKLNRVTFFDHVFYDTYRELAGAGWERADAVTAASALAKQQTIYHMLDFSNMLQVEQNLRWLSYYATKHRLYWTWIGRQFTRKPLLAAAVGDIAQHLDPKGNLNVTIGGHRLDIPAARLVWANNTEYPETSPIVETLFRTGKNLAAGEAPLNAVASAFAAETATSGNVLTRQDQSIALLGKYIGILSGAKPATFGLAVEGMSSVQRAVFNSEMHNVILAYRADHDGRYPSEQYAVKATLLRATGNEVWRTNLFLPILPQTGKPTAIQNLITAFGEIRSPVKRRAFLAKHPEVSDYFGASSDQDVYLHEQPLWDQFNSISKQRDLELTRLRQEIDNQGYTPELAHEYKQLSARYSLAIQNLRHQDALTWKGNTTYPAGRVADNGEIQTEGPWSRKLDGDPIAARAFLHEAFPGIGAQQLDKHTIGQTVIDLQNEAARIRSLGWKQLGYPDERHAKERLSQISQTVDVFRSMPGNPTAEMVDAYYSKFVGPYIAMRDKLTAEQAKASSADKNVVYAETRAIKERYDHPVLVRDPVTGKDVKFPSPVSFGFTMLPPDQYHAALAGAVSSRWQDITGYEKTLLGVKTPPNVAEGWAAYQKTVEEWRQAPANAGHSLQQVQKASLARQIDKAYPGFYKDYLFAQQPKVRRYESTTLYQGMPTGQKQLFDLYVGGPAKQLAEAIKQTGSGAARMAYWRTYVRTEIEPWLAEHKQLAAELQLYGPDFLNTLPSAG